VEIKLRWLLNVHRFNNETLQLRLVLWRFELIW